ncbi:MAG: zinc ribbon domain-containing protein [Acidobacteria bacterium]|nr:zinc ribbon domain-containing protein [Acidobacteriota bacterium]
MSSEISIESRGEGSESLHPWQLFTLAGLVGATVVVFVSRGQTPSGIILLSLIIFTAAIVGVATWRTLAPLTGKDDPAGPQILGGRTRAALEREKALVLRTIKELEFDRAMGKVSDNDFAEMSTRLRARAAGLIRQLDAGAGYRDTIEREIQKRLRGPRGSAPRQAQSAPHQAGIDSAPQETAAAPAHAVARFCSSCGAERDPDARFCKHCGARMETAS